MFRFSASCCFRFGLFLICGLLLAPLCRTQAPAADATAPKPAITNGIFVSAAGTHYRDRLRVDRFCADLRALPFDEIILQVRVDGDALYDSQLVPRALGVEAKFDPLGAVLKQLRAPARAGEPGRPKKVIAWFDPYSLGSRESAGRGNPATTARAHTDWLSVRADGTNADENGNQYLEPALAEVQLQLEQVVGELAKQYMLDGILLDSVADPGDGRWGYHPQVLEQYRRATGATGTPEPNDPNWVRFRVDAISQAAAGLVRAIKQQRPKMMVALSGEAGGPAPAGLEQFATVSAYSLRHQNWPQWLAQGLCGRFYVKNFRGERTAPDDFDQWLKLALAEAAPANVAVQNVVSGPSNESVDALAQLRRSATLGAGGVALMDYASPVADAGARDLFMSAVGRAVLAPEPARLRLTSTLMAEAQSPATSATVASAQPQRLRPVLRAPGSEPAAPTAPPATTPPSGTSSTVPPNDLAGLPPTAAGAEDLPPPPPLSEVIAGGGARPPLTEVIEEDDGNLIPARPRPSTASAPRSNPPMPPSATRGGEPSLAEINQLAGMDLSGSARNQTTPPAPPPGEYVTRMQMLDEILKANDAAGEGRPLLQPDPLALNELRKRFGNIF